MANVLRNTWHVEPRTRFSIEYPVKSARSDKRLTNRLFDAAWATVHALDRGATWGPRCECGEASLVVSDEEHDYMLARCMRGGRREAVGVPCGDARWPSHDAR